MAIFSMAAPAQIHQPIIQASLIKTAPVIDGKLSDLSWKKASEMTEFVNWSLDNYIKDPVSVYLYYDDKNLYVAFKNSDHIFNINQIIIF